MYKQTIDTSTAFNHEPTNANLVYVHTLSLIRQNLAIGKKHYENKTGYVSVLPPFDGPKQNTMSTQGFMTGCVDTTTAANHRHHALNSISVKREQNTSQLR